MLITKASGEKVQFNRNKYLDSLKRAGLSVAMAREIANQIYQDLYPSISSDKIYQATQRVLKKKNKILAAKYSLKRALMELGPGGYYFERYMAAVLKFYGYQTKYNQFLFGRCVEHEVDIVAKRNNKKYMIECKYHTSSGVKSDVKVSLYVYARFLDLKQKHGFDEGVLITNTQFTTEAVKYADCVGLKVIGWKCPNERESLQHYVESKKLYPVTVLPSLTRHLNNRFREDDLVLIQDLVKFDLRSLVKKYRIKEGLAKRLLDEARAIIDI
jgi:hypothetical protein